MVIPIFIHKHDQQIPRTMEWSRGAAWLLTVHSLFADVVSLFAVDHSSCSRVFVPFAVPIEVPAWLYSYSKCDAFNSFESFDSFGYTQAAFNLNQYTASECGRFEQVPLLLSIALSRSRHTFAIHFERHSLRCIAPFKRFQSGFVLQSNGCSTTNVS